jgi:hypothetical protein
MKAQTRRRFKWLNFSYTTTIIITTIITDIIGDTDLESLSRPVIAMVTARTITIIIITTITTAFIGAIVMMIEAHCGRASVLPLFFHC